MKKKAKTTKKVTVEHGKMSDLLFRLEASAIRADQFQAEAKRHEANLIAICLAIGLERPMEQYSREPGEFNHIAFAKLPYMVAELRGFKSGIQKRDEDRLDEVDFLRKMVGVAMEDPMLHALADKISDTPIGETIIRGRKPGEGFNPDMFKGKM